MGGWKSKNETGLAVFEPPFVGANGTALDSAWTMMWAIDTAANRGFTATPRDIENTGQLPTGAARVASTRVMNPRFALNTVMIPSATPTVRFSITALNVASSNVTGMSVTDPAAYVDSTSDPATAGYGVLYADRNVPAIVSVWGGTTINLAWPFFHSPGSDTFRLGIEIYKGEVNTYHYHYVQPVDNTTLQEIYDDKFVLAATFAYTQPTVTAMHLGGILGNIGDIVEQFRIEHSPAEATRGVGPGFVFPPNQYGLFKSQLTLHGLLNNVKISGP